MTEGREQYELPESCPGETQHCVDSFSANRVFADPEQAAPYVRQAEVVSAATRTAVRSAQQAVLFCSGMATWSANRDRRRSTA
jgi:hypothetical protein